MRLAVRLTGKIRMCSPADRAPSPSTSSDQSKKRPNFRVRFRHGVYPNIGVQATRAEIKKYDYFFESGQKWVNTKGKVDFVDESSHVADEAELTADSGEGSRDGSRDVNALRRPVRIQQGTLQETPNTEITSTETDPRNVAHAGTQTHAGTALTPVGRITNHDADQSAASSESGSYSILYGPELAGSRPMPHSVSEYQVAWPLEDPVEARLFRYWVDKAAVWWDITSSEAIWHEMVPKLALTNPMLLNAIFLISSQHIQRDDPTFPAKPFSYHERILKYLIPYLAERGSIEDDATLAAAMLLRSFEEFHAGTQGQFMLSTFELFTTTGGSLLNTSSPIVLACFMVHVHFEIYQALLNQLSLQVNYQSFILPNLIHPMDDVAWENRMVWICARTLQWCGSATRTIEAWQELADLVEQWERERPASFDPFFYREGTSMEGRYFPEIWFPSLCHTDANQHLRICRLALAMHHPQLSTNEGEPESLDGWRKREVLTGLKELVAIARCNPHAISAPSIAAHAIHRFGPALEHNVDRQAMLSFLEDVNGMGWPTKATMQWLRRHWEPDEGRG